MSYTTIEPRALSDERLRPNPFEELWRSVPHALVILLVGISAFFAHELGHALAAQWFGARIVLFNVLGMQWYPTVAWMPQFGFGGYVYWFAPVNLTNHRLIMMAGSNFTMLLALGAVIALNVTRVHGAARVALAVMSLYFLDSLVHSLPMLGWVPPGWSSRFTRSFSEAYFAAVGLGIPSPLYLGAVLCLSLLITVMLVRALRR